MVQLTEAQKEALIDELAKWIRKGGRGPAPTRLADLDQDDLDNCADGLRLGKIIIEQSPYDRKLLGKVLYDESQLVENSQPGLSLAEMAQSLVRAPDGTLIRKGGTYAEYDYEHPIPLTPDEHRHKFQVPSAKKKLDAEKVPPPNDVVYQDRFIPIKGDLVSKRHQPYNVLKTLEFGALGRVDLERTETLLILYTGHQ